MRKLTLCDYAYEGSPMFRVLSWFYTMRDNDYHKTEISHSTGVARTTLQSVIPVLLDSDIIKVNRTVGNIDMYKINMSPEEVSSLIRKMCCYNWVMI